MTADLTASQKKQMAEAARKFKKQMEGLSTSYLYESRNSAL